MSGTPRLRSAFPSTPQTDPRRSSQNAFSPGPQYTTPSVAQLPAAYFVPKSSPNEPLIPFQTITAPQQRLFVAAFYGMLVAWKIYEWAKLSDDLDSTWAFLKWVAIDGIVLFGLPVLRIPWLEWALSTTVAAFILHIVLNAFLMFRIPIPVGSLLAWLVKFVYDTEVSISEKRVKPAGVLHNSSLILGKQIIQILPEGSAMLNPERLPFCLDSRTTSIDLPIRINQTSPILIELLRFDLDTNEPETITISAKEARRLKKQAEKRLEKPNKASPRFLQYPVKKPGLYQLQRVIDETKLEVQRRLSDTLVVRCPGASISDHKLHKEKDEENHRCKNDLSDLLLHVVGTPPLRVKYNKRVNHLEHSHSFQSIQPEDYSSPLAPHLESGALVDPKRVNVSWARASDITVPIKESLNLNGSWTYIIEEVQDALGNQITYPLPGDTRRKTSKVGGPDQRYIFTVHQRPRISFGGRCNAQRPLKVAKQDSVEMPLLLHPRGQLRLEDFSIKLNYSFTGEGDTPIAKQFEMKTERSAPRIRDAGRYSLEGVETKFCAGEIIEPSSCVLENPPEPGLSLSAEDISDKCAGSPIGLMVDLDLTGTPPFTVRYKINHNGRVSPRNVRIDGLRGRLELVPERAGHYIYEFLDVSDSVYDNVALSKKIVLEQDVRPPSSAHFIDPQASRMACFGEPVSADVQFLGEGPWELEYELVHRDRRTKHKIRSAEDTYKIVTPPLRSGGEYAIVLSSVLDKLGCKRSLQEDIKVQVRSDQARLAFGEIDRRRTIRALENKPVSLPLRLSGQAPWTVGYKNQGERTDRVESHVLQDANGYLKVTYPGKYEIVSVRDSCPGLVDPVANVFEVQWITRPTIKVLQKATDNSSADGHHISKAAVCQGDEASLELAFTGAPPYTVTYKEQYYRKASDISVLLGTGTKEQKLTAAMTKASIRMDTSKAGHYRYTFNFLSDNLYDHDPSKYRELMVTQDVNAPPSAKFGHPGHTYGYCKEEAGGEEVIPIILEGTPPFALEVALRHHASARPEILTYRDIQNHTYDLKIPRQRLELGTHNLHIRKVSDERRCESRAVDHPGSSSVRVRVSDVPTIIPMDSHTDFCVGERLSFTLSGQPPFGVDYTFQNLARHASVSSTTFKRLAEQPGEFVIDSLSDSASGKCKAKANIVKHIHPMPSVKVSKGGVSVVDIHEGGEAEILFEFGGTPPFEFTYTRSENAKKGKRAVILETKHDKSYEFSKTVRASDAGTYEVVAIKDKYCSFSTAKGAENVGWRQKLLQQ